MGEVADVTRPSRAPSHSAGMDVLYDLAMVALAVFVFALLLLSVGLLDRA